MTKFLTVFNFELKQFLKKKSTLVTLAIYLILALGVTFVPRIAQSNFFKGESNSNFERSAYVVKNVKISTDNLKQAKKYNSREDIEKDVKDGKLDEGIVLIDKSYEYISKSNVLGSSTSEFKEVFNENVKKLIYSQNNIDYNKVEQLNSKIPQPKVVNVNSSNDDVQSFFNLGVVYVISFVIYMTVIMFGNIVAINVVKEKSHRAMELLLVTVKPKTLILGKVLALSVAVLVQIGVIAGAVFVGVKVNFNYYNEILKLMINNINVKLLVVGLIFAVTGYIMFMFMYAAFASLASKVEEVNTAIMVPMLLFVGVFFANFYVMSNSGTKIAEILSYVPFTSHLVMFTRYALVNVSNFELAISYAILLGTTILVALASVRVYRLASLRYGKKLSFFKLLLG